MVTNKCVIGTITTGVIKEYEDCATFDCAVRISIEPSTVIVRHLVVVPCHLRFCFSARFSALVLARSGRGICADFIVPTDGTRPPPGRSAAIGYHLSLLLFAVGSDCLHCHVGGRNSAVSRHRYDNDIYHYFRSLFHFNQDSLFLFFFIS